MRVLQVVGEFAPERCGIAHYTVRLTQELNAAGVDAAICSPTISVERPVPLLRLRRSGWSLQTLLDLVATAGRRRADWLHLQYGPGSYGHRRVVALLPLVAKLLPGAPRIAATVHEIGGWPLGVPGWIAPLADRVFSVTEHAGWFDREALALLGMSDLLIVTNPNHFETIGRHSPRVASRAQLIPIGPNVGPEVARETTREEARRRLGVPDDRFVAVFFGFVHPIKGIETLLHAMQRVGTVHPSAVLWIAGGVRSLALSDGDADRYEARIRRMIDDLGLRRVVELTGYLPDDEAARRLKAADLAVLPFNNGATLKSGTLITCLTYGLPVLSTTGGNLGALWHGESIWLIPPRDPTALADAVCLLAADGALRERLAAAGAARASEFSWPHIVRRHLELYSGRQGIRPER